MTAALVLDGEQRAALAVVRSLAKQGVRVEVVSARPSPIAGRAHGVAQVHRSPAPEASAAVFQEWLSRRSEAFAVPVTDTTTMLVRSRPESADDGYEALTDKAALVSLATAHGVPAPRGSVAGTPTEAIAAAARMGYPVVLKPARSKALMDDRVISTAVRVARDAVELERTLERSSWFPRLPVIVQEFVPGHGAGVFCLYDRDRPLAWFAHRRLREKPPAGGVSVLSESVPVDPVLRAYAESLLRAARYRGVAMVEFRVGSDGRPYLMEVNARFWGSLQLAIDCGVDFPWMYWQLLHGQAVTPAGSYPSGRRLRWWLGDLDNLLLQLRDPALGAGTRLEAVRRFLATGFDASCRQEVFRWSDPGPGLLEARLWLAGVLGRTP